MEEMGEDFSFGISFISGLQENVIIEVLEALVEDIICEDLAEDGGNWNFDSEVSGSEHVTGENIHNSYDSDWSI